jgi:hypothetical protein
LPRLEGAFFKGRGQPSEDGAAHSQGKWAVHRFASSHKIIRPVPGMTALLSEREAQARETRYSWALVILLSLATMTVALSTTISPVSSEPAPLTAK